jgi:hypothetical protein
MEFPLFCMAFYIQKTGLGNNPGNAKTVPKTATAEIY